MPDELVNMSSQFKGLPMGDLIGGPLDAACEAQVKLDRATADFIRVIGFLPPAAGSDNPTQMQTPEQIEAARALLNRCLSDSPKGAIIGTEKISPCCRSASIRW